MSKEDLPSRVRRLDVRSRKLVEELLAGNYHSIFKGSGLEFDEVREYEYGDDVRFIDWNVSSRMTTPYSKTYREERELILMVLVDVSASLSLGVQNAKKRDTVGNVFALLALAAVANNDCVGSVLFSDSIERLAVPMKGRRHVLRQISDVLGHETLGRGSNMNMALKVAGQTLKRSSIVVIISDFLCDDYQLGLSILSRRHDVIAVRVIDDLDKSFPRTGLVELKDPESRDSLNVFGRSGRFLKDYSDFWQNHRSKWLRTCRESGVDVLEVSTEDEVAVCLHGFFKRRKK